MITYSSTTLANLKDGSPLYSKTYTGLIGSANDAANASFYFAKIHPDNYTTNYKVKMKVRVTAPEAYAETIDIQFGGYGNTFSSFDAYTTRTGSIGIYYINLYRATQAGISTNHKGHALGIGLRSSTNPTSTSYKRTVIVDILELDGCTIEMLDTAVKYANIDGTGSTNYYGLTEMAVGTAGQNATNNSNTHYTQYSNNVKAGTNGIKGYTLIMKDSENTWSCFYSGAYKVANTGKPVYTGGFILGKILYSAGAGAQTSDSSLDTYYNYKSGVNTSTIYDAYPVDLRYSTNCASTLTSQRPVYIVGTIENDGLFHLDASQWYTQTEPTYADGKVYVYVGIAYSTYQVWLSTENPAYMFYNGEFILYDKAQTLQNINTLKNSLEIQIDSKVETWCQKTNPATSWTAEERPNHTGDLWYYIGESGTTYKNNTTYQYNGETNVWSAYSANPDLFDKIDGKTAIYYGTTSSVTSAEEGDYLVDSENDCTYRWNNGAWVLATDYKQVAIDAVEIGGRNLIRNTADWKNCPYAGDTATVNGEEFIAPTTTGTNWRRINGWFTKTKEDVYFSPIIISFDVKKSDETPLSELVFQLFTTSKAYKEQTSGNLPEGSRYYINLANSIWKNTENVNKDTWTRVYSIPIIMQERFNTTSYTEYDYLAFYIGVKAATSSASFRYLKIEKGNIVTDWTPAPEDTQADIDTALVQSVEYIIGTQTAATGTWTGVTTDKELKVGKTIAYKLPYAGSGNASLVLTLADGSVTNAIPIYLNTTRVTTHFGANSVINMTYDGTAWRASSIPNTNETNHILNNFSGKTGALGIWQTGLFMKDGNGTYQNICTDSSGNITRTNANTKKVNPNGFEIGSSIYLSTSGTTYAANANITGAVYASYGAFDSRYSLNAEGANALTAYMPIYLTGTINDIDGLFHLDTVWWTQTPTDSDKVYVLIGGCYDYYHTSSADYWRITLYEQNNWYKYVDGALVDYSNNLAELAATTATAFIAVDTDNNGIMVHPENDMASGWQIGTAINLVKGGLNYLKLWFDNLTAKIRIGNEEENHLLIDNEGLYFNGVENNEIKELAAFKATGISFNNETPYRIGNDNTYIRFEDTNSDGKADKLSIVADSISFADSNETVQAQLENLQNGFDSIQNNNYIKIIPSEPSITIAADSNESISSLKLTSDKLSFMVQDNEIAYMANDQMDIPTASVTNLFMQSADNTYEKLWVMRSNGHLSLKTVKKD